MDTKDTYSATEKKSIISDEKIPENASIKEILALSGQFIKQNHEAYLALAK